MAEHEDSAVESMPKEAELEPEVNENDIRGFTDPVAPSQKKEEEPEDMETFFEKIPTPMFAMPAVLLMQGVTWTPELVAMGQLIVSTEVLICFGILVYIKMSVEEKRSSEKMLWVRPAQYPNTPPEHKNDPYVQVSELTLEKAQIGAMQKQLFMSALISFVLPQFFGVNQPILLQSIIIPVSFLRNKLFVMHVIGIEPENPWKAVSEEKALRENPELKNQAAEQRAQDELVDELPEREKFDAKYGSDSVSEVLANKLGADAQRIASAGLKTDPQVEVFETNVKAAIKASMVNVQHKETKTSFLMALSRHCYDEASSLMKELLDAGADPLLEDVDGWTALHWAAFYGNVYATRTLLTYVKDKNDEELLDKLVAAKTLDGSTPIDIARSELKNSTDDGEEVIKLLEAAAAVAADEEDDE